MFELTNEQRKCFAIPPVLDNWKKVEVKAGPYDHCVTFAYLDGRRIVKVIKVSETRCQEMYHEYGVDQMLSEDSTKILPKTEKGKPQNFTAPNLLKKTPLGMTLSFCRGYVDVINNTADQYYYRSNYEAAEVYTLDDLSKWVDDWCRGTGEQDLAEINEFANRPKIHQKFSEGDFFRYRIKRGLYGYGRIMVDYAKMRKDGVPFWEIFMGKPLCVAVYHIVTDDPNVTAEHLVKLKMLPSQMIMDNVFFYGECEVIGNIPLSPTEDNFTIHYGNSIDARKPHYLYYQCGKKFVSRFGKKELYGDFMNSSIGWDLNVGLPILLECIKQNSNDPYWSMIKQWRANEDLRNPKFKKELEQIKKQMRVK